AEMVKNGYSRKPALLGRSRGGLWVSSWALEHPERVAGIGGIYPVYDYTTYPGVERAAPAYGLSEKELLAQQQNLNPIKRAGELAEAKIPVFIIHGTDDTVVPLAANSGALEKIYAARGAADLITVIKAKGQGHSFWPGFFTCQGLVDFLVERAQSGARGEGQSAEAPAAAAGYLPLVVLLGDSIRINYQATVRDELSGVADVWSPKENGKHTAYTLENLEKWLSARNPQVVHINVGLHDLFLNSSSGKPRHTLATYGKNLGAIFSKLRELTDAKIVFALTTAVDEDRQATSETYGRVVRRNKDIDRYNARARKIAGELGITVNDLNAVVKQTGALEVLCDDGIHLSEAGCRALGAAVAGKIGRELSTASGR
ncbi:MAG: GDSL-type esterase/lipase family protein, partial [Verrucomicrobiales bacterium]